MLEGEDPVTTKRIVFKLVSVETLCKKLTR